MSDIIILIPIALACAFIHATARSQSRRIDSLSSDVDKLFSVYAELIDRLTLLDRSKGEDDAKHD